MSILALLPGILGIAAGYTLTGQRKKQKQAFEESQLSGKILSDHIQEINKGILSGDIEPTQGAAIIEATLAGAKKSLSPNTFNALQAMSQNALQTRSTAQKLQETVKALSGIPGMQSFFGGAQGQQTAPSTQPAPVPQAAPMEGQQSGYSTQGKKGKGFVAQSLPPDLEQFAQQKAQQYGVPWPIVQGMMHGESSYNPTAVSPKGAYGYMQIMPKTFTEIQKALPHLKSRENPRDNIEAGIYYYKQQLDEFKDPALALAAYNAGPDAVRKYGGVPPYKETRGYVPRVMQFAKAYEQMGAQGAAQGPAIAEGQVAPSQVVPGAQVVPAAAQVEGGAPGAAPIPGTAPVSPSTQIPPVAGNVPSTTGGVIPPIALPSPTMRLESVNIGKGGPTFSIKPDEAAGFYKTYMPAYQQALSTGLKPWEAHMAVLGKMVEAGYSVPGNLGEVSRSLQIPESERENTKIGMSTLFLTDQLRRGVPAMDAVTNTTREFGIEPIKLREILDLYHQQLVQNGRNNGLDEKSAHEEARRALGGYVPAGSAGEQFTAPAPLQLSEALRAEILKRKDGADILAGRVPMPPGLVEEAQKSIATREAEEVAAKKQAEQGILKPLPVETADKIGTAASVIMDIQTGYDDMLGMMTDPETGQMDINLLPVGPLEAIKQKLSRWGITEDEAAVMRERLGTVHTAAISRMYSIAGKQLGEKELPHLQAMVLDEKISPLTYLTRLAGYWETGINGMKARRDALKGAGHDVRMLDDIIREAEKTDIWQIIPGKYQGFRKRGQARRTKQEQQTSAPPAGGGQGETKLNLQDLGL